MPVSRSLAMLAATFIASAATTVAVPGTAAAALRFNATTRNAGNSWTASTSLLQPYTAQVLASNPSFYYPVDESSGTLASDFSGNNRNGTYTAIGAYGQPGALPDDFGWSIALNGGGGRIVGGGAAAQNPTTFTLELWFRTTTTAGGKLIGFESTQGATSPTYDRHLYMAASGQLVYGGWSNGPVKTITSPLAYNDGKWHYLALTCVPNGQNEASTMYVDGAAVASGTTTKVSSYSGWWRVGYGSLPTGAGYPTPNFTGNIDNVAVYPTALSATTVAAHYGAR